MSPIYEEQFSENSFGFRPKRGAHDALKQCQQNVNDGYVYVVDMDLEKFFDTVCQSKLIEVLSRTIKDGRVISLIRKYLNAGVISRGVFEKTEAGMPQGGPLSSLLSNVMLNELDRELTKRNNGWGNEYRAMKLTQYVRGWVNYFSLADMKGLLKETDEWLKHKIRTIYWKQWKKVKTKFKELKKLGVEEEKAWICANMRNGNWYCGGYFVLQTAFNNKKLRELGYPTFTEFYLKVCEN